MRTHTSIAIVQDHSASMRGLTKKAMDDYNLMLDGIKNSAKESDQDVTVSIIECGVGAMGTVRVAIRNHDIDQMKHLSSYVADGGGTPLFDSVGQAMTEAGGVKFRSGDSPAYLVLVITDGQENASRTWNAASLAAKIVDLQNTDEWTFAFRVPRGQRGYLERLGIHPGNIMEWEQTSESYTKSTEQTVSGIQTFFRGRAAGKTSQTAFYANIGDVPVAQVKASLVDVSKDFTEYRIPSKCDGMMIKDFCEKHGPGRYDLGSALYQLTKPEKAVQDYKVLCVRDRVTNKIYTGQAARQLLGLPASGTVKLIPGRFGSYDLFVQSTSVNRRLVGETSILYKR